MSIGLEKPVSQFTYSDLIIPENNQRDINSIKNRLISLHLTLTIVEDALHEFANYRYKAFDALIGNNSCYLVSYIIFLIAHRFRSEGTEKIHSFLRILKKAKQKLVHLFSFPTSIALLKKEMASALDINLDPDFIYLAMAYACTHAKHKNDLDFEKTDYRKLIELYRKRLGIEIPKKTAAKLIKYWQKNLSIQNIRTLQNQSIQLDNLWSRYTSDPYILSDERERLCAPSLYSAATIYSNLLHLEGSVLGLQVNVIEYPKNWISRFTLFYRVQKDHSLKLINQEEIDPNEPIYMFVGCRYVSDASKTNIHIIREEFERKSLKTIVFAHEATYPQYPKSLKAPDICPDGAELIEKINGYKKLKGFSLEDPSDLCLVHIFVSDILTQSLSSYDPPIFLPQLSPEKEEILSC